VELRLLGPFEVVVDGAPVVLPGRLPRALLAVLAVRANQVVSTDALVDAVWDGKAPESAASVLRLYVTQVRRALPERRLLTRPAGYQLIAEPGELDASRFEDLLAEGRRASLDGNARLSRSLCRRALALWRGPALSDLAGKSFARDEGARLDELRLACTETRLESELLLGLHAEVLAELEQLVVEHPLHERLRVLLMLALYRGGRQADALGRYQEGRELLVGELGLEPGHELRELQGRILVHDPALAAPDPAPPAPSVAPPSTATIGRVAELATLRTELLDRGARLVTLVGPGGIGKTRLAVQAAFELGPHLADGAVFVDASRLARPAQLLPAIGRALGLRETGEEPWPAVLGRQLRGLEQLLVLDNLEHLVEGIAPLSALLDEAPRVSVLATSRRPLRLAAERVVDVQPLDGPAALELLAARASDGGAAVDRRSGDVAAVCDRLDGMPLAIELTAPWLRTLPAAELLQMLERRLDVMRRGRRDAPERHRTMRAAIDWSVGLLDPGERRLLGRLSVFNGGFTTEAMLALDDGATVEQLDALVEASVVRSREGRHRLLEVVRAYAGELPSADEAARAAHARYFAALAERAAPELVGGEQGRWLERLEVEHDNLRSALDWLGGNGEAALELRTAAALARFWYVRGYLTEGLDRLRSALEHAPPGDATLRAGALRGASALALLKGDYVLARSLVEDALALYRELADPTGVVRSLSNLGAILHAQRELAVAAMTLDECIAAAEAVDDPRLLALACNNRGDVALSQGDLPVAERHFTRSLVILRAGNDVANVARALFNLGAVALEQGRHADARRRLAESVELAEQVDDGEDVAWCLIALAAVAEAAGEHHDAALMLGFAEGLLERIGATMKPFELGLFERTRERLGGAMDAAALAELLRAGARLPRADARRLVVASR
jgi:predicted ATPase/DNA-binding SARP family transcriptional activator